MINEQQQQQLIQIRNLYGRNELVDTELIRSYFAKPDHASQTNFISYLLSNRVLQAHAPSLKYRQAFLKRVIAILEEKVTETMSTSDELEVHQQFYDVYLSWTSTPQQETYFAVLFSNQFIDETPIVIEQYANIISHGTTGLHVWPACTQLIEFLSSRPHLLDGRVVLELGSGVGLLGLSCLLLRLSPALVRHFVFTDSHALVLEQIARNLQWNRATTARSSLCELDWRVALSEQEVIRNESLSDLDLILASDIVFDPDLTEPLARTLDSLVGLARSQVEILVASTIRNEETYNQFLLCLERFGFKHESLEKRRASVSVGNNSTPECFIEILRIFK